MRCAASRRASNRQHAALTAIARMMMAKGFDKSRLWAWRKMAERSVHKRSRSEMAAPEDDAEAEDRATKRLALEEMPSHGEESMLDRYRSRLSAQYHLDSEYLSVSQIARILGLSPSAIHADMRSGRFFLPYRLFDSAPKIFIDDLVEWHCSRRGVVPAFGAKTGRAAPLDSEDASERIGEDESAQGNAEMDAAVVGAADAHFRSTGVDPRALCEQGRQL
ncbi:hypothetical protein NM04_14900 [Massilia aurea]|uniref:Uncharacterized protein n=2 Tax=Massilia aurea TaxID=373040 RepID=A0A422QJ72_9BURK|nr:hypothetical protein NM04_14900 [Massilia aurea]